MLPRHAAHMDVSLPSDDFVHYWSIDHDGRVVGGHHWLLAAEMSYCRLLFSGGPMGYCSGRCSHSVSSGRSSEYQLSRWIDRLLCCVLTSHI